MTLFWTILALSILPLWLLQNTIHELAHGLTMKLGWGWRFRIYPFPSYKLGRFTFAHTVFSPGPSSVELSRPEKALVAIMPKLINLLMVFGSSIGAIVLLDIMKSNAALPLILFLLFNYIDFSTGMLAAFGSNERTDIHVFRRNLGLSQRIVRIWASAMVGLVAGVVFIPVWHAISLFLM